jgi:hypothetical protein
MKTQIVSSTPTKKKKEHVSTGRKNAQVTHARRNVAPTSTEVSQCRHRDSQTEVRCTNDSLPGRARCDVHDAYN